MKSPHAELERRGIDYLEVAGPPDERLARTIAWLDAQDAASL